MRSNGIKLLAILGLMTGLTVRAEPVSLWSLEGFAEPESVLADAQGKRLYVSNIEGNPVEMDGNGSISLVGVDGKMLKRHWVTDLDAPKGMALFDQFLYVADMQKLHKIDIRTAELVTSYNVPTAGMLNDVATDELGRVYVSDLLKGGVYRVVNEAIAPWLSANLIPHPNGLTVKGEKLWVATWGEGLHDDFTTDVKGHVLSVDLATQEMSVYSGSEALGNLDGIAIHKDQIWVNDWITGEVFTLTDSSAQLVMAATKSSADISIDRGVLYVPVMFKNRIEAYAIP